MISGVWVNTRVESRQDNTAITNAMDRIAVSTVPSSPPRKRALEDMQVDVTNNAYGGTDGMTHVAALDSGGLTGCDLIPIRRICRSYRHHFTPEYIYDQP